MSSCPRCGRPVHETADARGSLCPACLMEAALEPASANLGPPCRVLSVIGRSARGTTFLAESEDGSSLPRYVALKVHDATTTTAGASDRLRRIQLEAGRAIHPMFAPMLDAGLTSDGRPFFVFEYVRGLPVAIHCEHFRLDRAARLTIVSAVGVALAAAHRAGLAHGALRASNVIVSAPGGPGAIRVLDLGEAMAMSALHPEAPRPSADGDLEDLEALRRELVSP